MRFDPSEIIGDDGAEMLIGWLRHTEASMTQLKEILSDAETDVMYSSKYQRLSALKHRIEDLLRLQDGSYPIAVAARTEPKS